MSKKMLRTFACGVALLLIVFCFVGCELNPEEYTLGSDKVPGVRLVLGARKLAGTSTEIKNDVTVKTYKYKDVYDVTSDMVTYTERLVNTDGFMFTKDYDFAVKPGTTQLGKASLQEGYIILVDLSYTSDTFEITLTKTKGTLTSIS